MSDANVLDVLLVQPKKAPERIQIANELSALQEAVGGYIEAVYPFQEPVALICNEEGKLQGLAMNRSLCTEEGEIYDVIAGDFLVVGLSGYDFCSLTPELMQQFEERFHTPELFMQMGRGIMVLPMPEEVRGDGGAKAPHKPAPDMER